MKTYQHLKRLSTSGRLTARNYVDAPTRCVVALASPDKELMERLGGRYFHLPVPDGRVVEDHVAAAMVVAYLYNGGWDVIVHCHAGRNRACFIVALALGILKALNGREALEHVRKVRPRAIANPHFEKYLLEEAP